MDRPASMLMAVVLMWMLGLINIVGGVAVFTYPSDDKVLDTLNGSTGQLCATALTDSPLAFVLAAVATKFG